MGVVRDTGKFSGHPYIGRIARSSLRQLSFLVIKGNLTRLTVTLLMVITRFYDSLFRGHKCPLARACGRPWLEFV